MPFVLILNIAFSASAREKQAGLTPIRPIHDIKIFVLCNQNQYENTSGIGSLKVTAATLKDS